MMRSSRAPWRKSSYSADTANCLEFSPSEVDVAVRDSKNPGPVLSYDTQSWRSFIAAVRGDMFGRHR